MIRTVIGTLLNVAGIVTGGIAGMVRSKPLSGEQEAFLKILLGVFTVFFGLRLAWISINGTMGEVLKQLLVLLLSLMTGKLTGHLLRLQKFSNRLGQTARELIEKSKPGDPDRANRGFKTCAILFCAAPLGFMGAVQDGLSGYFAPLVIKGVIDGLATMGFARLFGWGVLLAGLPVLALQGTISLLCLYLAPFLAAHGLLNPLNATGGLLVFSVALVVLGLKRIELADYLPSLVAAPLLAWVIL